jgi:hypothetical protein
MMRSKKEFGVLIGVVFFIIPVALFILWIYACNQTNGYPNNVELYESYLPNFLKGRFTTTILSIVFWSIAIGLNARNLNDSHNFLKIVSWFIVITSGLLGLLNLFSMM